MSGLRTTGTIMLVAAIILGLAGIFFPTAHTIANGMEERYSILGFEHIHDDETTETGWSDTEMEDKSGITYLRGSPILYVAGLILLAAAIILTAAPNTRETFMGAIFGGMAFVCFVFAILTHHAGLVLHNTRVFGRPDLFEGLVGTWLIVAMIVLLFAATLMGMIVYYRDVPMLAGGARNTILMRRMRCPECSNIESVAPGHFPTCGDCGYSS